MKMKKQSFHFLAVSFLFAVASVSIFTQPPDKGQDKDKGTPTDDISTKARNVKPELKEAYKRWLNQDVAYIITKEERRAFLALQTDEERENLSKILASP